MTDRYLIGAPRYSEGLMRALALKGDLPRELLAELSASITLDDMSAAEFQWTKRSAMYELGTSQAASPGNFGIVAFTTRVAAQGRSVMAIVDQVIIGNANAATAQVAYGVSFGGTSIADPTAVANRRDDRALAITSSYSLNAGTAAASPLAGTSHKLATMQAGGEHIDDAPFILTNNDNGTNRSALVFVTSVVNQVISVSVSWREREIYQEELV